MASYLVSLKLFGKLSHHLLVDVLMETKYASKMSWKLTKEMFVIDMVKSDRMLNIYLPLTKPKNN